jgi:hypothetical protein
VTARGGRDGLGGIEALADGRQVLKVRVRALPENGAANQAVLRLLARATGRPATAVHLVAGATARVKTFRIEGDPAGLAATLSLAAEGAGSDPGDVRENA